MESLNKIANRLGFTIKPERDSEGISLNWVLLRETTDDIVYWRFYSLDDMQSFLKEWEEYSKGVRNEREL